VRHRTKTIPATGVDRTRNRVDGFEFADQGTEVGKAGHTFASKFAAKHDERTGYVLPRQHYRMWFEIALKAAGVKNFSWHDLRHTFGSRATMAGVDLRTPAQLMGHKTLQMTMRYSHLVPAHLQDAVSKLVGFGIINKVSPTDSNSY